VISARNLSKRFDVKRVFAGVDVEVALGDFLLVTGPNGAGKTTLLRVLAGLAAPTAGELELPDRALVGYLGHEPLVYRELTPLENLHLFGRLYRVPERGERVGMLLERFGLWDVRTQRVGTFSRGMQQRLALCRVLLHDPQALVLDEPANGLDPLGARQLRDLIRELAAEGLTVLLCSHDLSEVAADCSDVTFVARGRDVWQGPVADLTARPGRCLMTTSDDARARELADFPLDDVEIGLSFLATTEELDSFVLSLGQHGIAVRTLSRESLPLEQALRELVG
jgi:ABC-2 type transport system ATP-binding protein